MKTPSASCRRSASRLPVSTSRSPRSLRRWTNSSAETGIDVPIHVDAASGGFLAPFVQPEIVWDFRLPRVRSINASGHKFGLAPLGVGWAIWREASDLPEGLIFHVNYLGGDMPTFALNFSRPGGQVVCQYYLMLRLGMDGYRRIHQACYYVAQHIGRGIGRNGAVRGALRRRQPLRNTGRLVDDARRTRATAIRSSISPNGCARAAGKSRRIRWSPTSPTWPSCAC